MKGFESHYDNYMNQPNS